MSWYRILLLLPGIGDRTARAAIAAMAQAAWESAAFARYRPPPRARVAHDALVSCSTRSRAGGQSAAGERGHCARAPVVRRHSPGTVRSGRAAPQRSRSTRARGWRLSEPVGVPGCPRARATVQHPRPRRSATTRTRMSSSSAPRTRPKARNGMPCFSSGRSMAGFRRRAH